MLERKQELYKSTIDELKHHFLQTGWGDLQAIPLKHLERYIDIYPNRLDGVFLSLDFIEIRTKDLVVKVSKHAELLSDSYSDSAEKEQAEQVANSVLHQLSVMFPLYQTRLWIEHHNSGQKTTERTMEALTYLAENKRFI